MSSRLHEGMGASRRHIGGLQLKVLLGMGTRFVDVGGEGANHVAEPPHLAPARVHEAGTLVGRPRPRPPLAALAVPQDLRGVLGELQRGEEVAPTAPEEHFGEVMRALGVLGVVRVARVARLQPAQEGRMVRRVVMGRVGGRVERRKCVARREQAAWGVGGRQVARGGAPEGGELEERVCGGPALRRARPIRDRSRRRRRPTVSRVRVGRIGRVGREGGGRSAGGRRGATERGRGPGRGPGSRVPRRGRRGIRQGPR